jgi:hypothetical protein
LATRTRPPLGAEETRAVLRRAAELDREHGAASVLLDSAGPRIDPADLEQIAAESGLSPESLQRAIDELEGGALEAREGEAAGRVFDATARQTFAEPAESVERRLSALLTQSGLEPVRREPHATRWEPAPGLHHAVGRAINLRGSSAFIGSTIESSVYAVPGGRSSAALRGNAKDLRLPFATLAALALAYPAGIALLVALAVGLRAGFGLQHAFACLVIVGAWLFFSALVSRGLTRRRVRKLRRSLERLLAQAGDAAPSTDRNT